MPIRPEMRDRYPANWKSEIRPRILARANNRCEFCGVRNHIWGFREQDKDGKRSGMFMYGGETASEAADTLLQFLGDGSGNKLVRIVLTIAHLHDMDPANCADANLAALCQRCHNIHDMPMRKANAAARRHREKASGDLLEGCSLITVANVAE